MRLRQLRLWQDETKVAACLRRWAEWYWGEDALTPGDADGAAEVAEALRGLGRSTGSADDVAMLRLVWTMLYRVTQGRSPTAVEPVSIRVLGYPKKTTSRGQRTARDTTDDDGGLAQAFERLQRELDLDVLVKKGYARSNALRWRQRNADKRPWDAPPPRRRRTASVSDQRSGEPRS